MDINYSNTAVYDIKSNKLTMIFISVEKLSRKASFNTV